ncbi:hypothetical protein DSECCO2_44960 [anaerobic digester metagenome]
MIVNGCWMLSKPSNGLREYRPEGASTSTMTRWRSVSGDPPPSDHRGSRKGDFIRVQGRKPGNPLDGDHRHEERPYSPLFWDRPRCSLERGRTRSGGTEKPDPVQGRGVGARGAVVSGSGSTNRRKSKTLRVFSRSAPCGASRLEPEPLHHDQGIFLVRVVCGDLEDLAVTEAAVELLRPGVRHPDLELDGART